LLVADCYKHLKDEEQFIVSFSRLKEVYYMKDPEELKQDFDLSR
jgi:hypothetical protein